MSYDFEGWATKNDLQCADGLTIRKDAFRVNDGKKVPLVWNHRHNSISDVLGHAVLENRDEGVYAYCSFNDSPEGEGAKKRVQHGDVTALSIWANNLQQVGKDILHGVIREVSLVLAGANPGAFVESVLSHGEMMGEDEDEGIFYTGENIYISHAETDNKKPESEKKEGSEESGKTVRDVINTMNEDQKKAMAIVVGQAIADAKKGDEKDEKEDEKEEKEVKHNMFEGSASGGSHISHDDMKLIMADAKRLGSLKEAVNEHIKNGVLAHALNTTGMTTATGTQTYGFNDPDMLFPDYRSLNNPPEWISRDMGWVNKLMGKVHHTPFSRIKSLYANITEDDARAKGYIKGNLKKDEMFTNLKRTTDPQTIYKRQKLDRDDITDITDFNVVAWIKAEMRVMLEEEIARAILIGDGRLSSSDDKIKEDHIRPVIKDVPLFNTVVKVSVPANATDDDIAKATIRAMIKARKNFKGSGKPDFWTTEDVTTDMLLLESKNGDALYKTDSELATKLRVNEIIPVEVMEGQQVAVTESGTTKNYPLIGVVVNMADYNVGADKGGQTEMFEDFDIDYNQYKYLIETRISGSLVKPFSALTIVLDKAAAAPVTPPSGS